ncbi:TonB-dependent receptor [Pseudomaricurvus alkylphenolicus]|uniref:TonB-dependent receptor n=1 Tax=Pseudomaricurvus alkylphenolicus TaxID=1306991 RepID=UPI00142067FD|nr:TonB-dependent receptor [Pseudomaricurvus alkylphenolicus]NIB39656.1 TonB-dependent receptor [Pseudomaricurvus alkylphenolicus]
MKNRYIPLAAVMAAVPVSMLSPLAVAVNPHHDMEEMVVSASPIHSQHSDNARPISVLNGEELRNKAAATLSQTLTGQVGISAASFGPGVGNPVIRGQSANRVKVMQDNLDTLDASNTSADHANTTEPLLAEQIEVLRGPATLRFGSGAIGGVVNVIDNRIPGQLKKEPFSGALETRHNSVNDETASVLRLDGQRALEAGGHFAWHADALYRESNNVDIPGFANEEEPEESSDGFIENSNANAKAGSLGFSWIGERGFVGFSVNRQENNYGIPAGAHEHHHDEEEHHDDEDHHEEEEHHEDEEHHEEEEHHDDEAHHDEEGHEDEAPVRVDMEQTRYDLKGQLNQPFAGFDKLTWRAAYNDYEHTELEGAEIGTLYTSEAFETLIELVHKERNGWIGAFGLQHLDRDYGAEGEEAFIPSMTNIQRTGLYWIEEKHWKHQWLEFGLRLEQQSVDPDDARSIDHDSTSASLGYHWSLEDIHQFSVVLGMAERAPSMEELVSDGAHIATQTYDLGDRSLDTENSRNLDLGYEWQPAPGGLVSDLKVNVFYNDIGDYIYQRNTGEEDHDSEFLIFQYDQQDATFKGAEVELNLSLSESVKLRLFADAVRAEFDQGGDVPRVSPDRVGAEFSIEQTRWSGSLQIIEAGEQDRPGEGEEATDGYTRLDASINVPFSVGENSGLVFFRATNLLDEEIRHATSFLREVAPEAGRGLSAGVRFSF